jgi:hypothetical protein
LTQIKLTTIGDKLKKLQCVARGKFDTQAKSAHDISIQRIFSRPRIKL